MSKLFVIENKNFTRNFTLIDQELQENEVEATECHVDVELGCRSIQFNTKTVPSPIYLHVLTQIKPVWSVFSHGIVCNIIDRLMTVEIPKVQHVHVRHYNKKCCTTIKRANLILDTLRHSKKPNFPHRKTRIIYHCNAQHFVRRLPNVHVFG